MNEASAASPSLFLGRKAARNAIFKSGALKNASVESQAFLFLSYSSAIYGAARKNTRIEWTLNARLVSDAHKCARKKREEDTARIVYIHAEWLVKIHTVNPRTRLLSFFRVRDSLCFIPLFREYSRRRGKIGAESKIGISRCVSLLKK